VQAQSETRTTDWIEGSTFTVLAPRPGIPQLTGPTGSSSDTTPTITWHGASDAARYLVYIYNTGTRVGTSYYTANAVTEYTVPVALPVGPYQVVVTAFNAAGEMGETRGYLDFSITKPAPKAGASKLTLPTRTTDRTPTITWTAATNAVSYEVKIVDGKGRRILAKEAVSTRTRFTPTTLLAKGTYQIFVRAYNADGNAGAWSAKHVLTIA
jgi:hypothetical protein